MDYIDRKALRDALYDADAITMNGVKILNQFPAADVAPVRHGKWLHTEIEDDEEWGGIWHKWTCDNCGYSVGNNPNGTNYCPNCGARMDRKDDT